jgi:GT2 family glycosyltransferase
MLHLSVIIPAYNHAQDVMRCAQSIRATTDPALTEILIQDDASPEYHGPTLFGPMCERNPRNLGFPGNCNAGARRARGDVLLPLNQDAYAVQPGWDKRLLDFFELTERAGVAGPTLLFPDGRVQSVGGEFDGAGQPYHTALGAANPDWEPINTPRQVQWVTGAAFAVRRQAWQDLGGFDESYLGGYFEDVDFCIRALLAGWEVWHRPNIRLYHHVGSTGGNPHFMRNALLFKSRYVDTHIVEPDCPYLMEHFWA